MWKRNDGFFLTEMLLTLAAWLIIAGVIFSLIIQAANHAMLVRQEYEATKILYEKLSEAKLAEGMPGSETIVMEQTAYDITQGNGAGEVCVTYEDLLGKPKQKCELYQ